MSGTLRPHNTETELLAAGEILIRLCYYYCGLHWRAQNISQFHPWWNLLHSCIFTRTIHLSGSPASSILPSGKTHRRLSLSLSMLCLGAKCVPCAPLGGIVGPRNKTDKNSFVFERIERDQGETQWRIAAAHVLKPSTEQTTKQWAFGPLWCVGGNRHFHWCWRGGQELRQEPLIGSTHAQVE